MMQESNRSENHLQSIDLLKVYKNAMLYWSEKLYHKPNGLIIICAITRQGSIRGTPIEFQGGMEIEVGLNFFFLFVCFFFAARFFFLFSFFFILPRRMIFIFLVSLIVFSSKTTISPLDFGAGLNFFRQSLFMFLFPPPPYFQGYRSFFFFSLNRGWSGFFFLVIFSPKPAMPPADI